jgi:ABC-type multidrug transport system ATPase subunit
VWAKHSVGNKLRKTQHHAECFALLAILMMAHPFAIETQDLYKDYLLPEGGTVQALASIHLQVPSAAGLAILGGAGSGKSTLLGLLAGHIQPSGGSVCFAPGLAPDTGGWKNGMDILANGKATLAQALACLENIHSSSDYLIQLLNALGLAGLRERPLATLSSIEGARVELAVDLLQPAPLLLLDDPPALDAAMAFRLRPLLTSLRDEKGITLVLATRIPAVALTLCERILVLREGRVVCEKSTQELLPQTSGGFYSIRVRGRLSASRSDWFGGMEVRVDGDDTLLTGPLTDAAALYGLLERTRDLGLQLIAVKPSIEGACALLDEMLGIV